MGLSTIIVRAVGKTYKSLRGVKDYAEKGGEFETCGGYSTGERIILTDPAIKELFSVRVAYGADHTAPLMYDM